MPQSLIIFSVVVVLLIGLVLSRRRRVEDEPSCAQCRYPVRGLPTPACPECGADLRKVGIHYPQPRFFQHCAGRVLAITVLVLIGNSALDTSLDYLLPVRKGSLEYLRFESTGRYVTVLLGSSAWTTDQNIPPYDERDIYEHTIEVTMPDGAVHRLTTSDPDTSYVEEKPDGSKMQHDQPLDDHALAEWLAPLGLRDVEEPQEGLPKFLAGLVREDLHQNVIGQYARGKLHGYSTSSPLPIWDTPAWYTWRSFGVFILWAMLWLIVVRREVQSPRHRAYGAIAAFVVIGLVTCNSLVGRVLPDRYRCDMEYGLPRGSDTLHIRNTAFVWVRWGDQLDHDTIEMDERLVTLRSPNRVEQRLFKRDAEPGYTTSKDGETPIHHDGPLDQAAIASWLRTINWQQDEDHLQRDAALVLKVLEAGLDSAAVDQSIQDAGGLGSGTTRVGSTWRDLGFVAFWGVCGIVLARCAKRRTRRGLAYSGG